MRSAFGLALAGVALCATHGRPASALSPGAQARVAKSSQLAPVVDSRLTPAQSLRGTGAPPSVCRNLVLVNVRYRSFDGRLHMGQIVVHKTLAREVVAIFRDLERLRFPIARAVPVVRYGWSDERSMADNNTSGFNYRTKLGDRSLSQHAMGRAIDINPMQNPFIYKGKRLPPDSRRDLRAPGTIVDGPVVQAFARRGWRWGGHFRHRKDWQHFSKTN